MAEELNMNDIFAMGEALGLDVDLATLSVADFEEVRGPDAIPTGRYELYCEAENIPHMVKSVKTDETGEQYAVIRLVQTYKITNVVDMEDLNKAESVMNRTYVEYGFPIKDKEGLLKDLGRLKAIAIDGGWLDKASKITVPELVQSFAGQRFIATITTRPDRKKPEFMRSFINMRTIKPADPSLDIPEGVGADGVVA